MHIADMVIDTYLAESVLLRTLKLADMKGAANVPEQIAMCQLYIHDAADRIHKWAKEAVCNFAQHDQLARNGQLGGLADGYLAKPFDLKALLLDVERLIGSSKTGCV